MKNKITLKEGGEYGYIKVGNTVIDVMYGYLSSGAKEPCAVINIYKYDNNKISRHIVYKNCKIIDSE